ncbi:hypothetical protein P43SY_001088 [Pythium insidiosum]|uniref:Sugar phosphate transporter domain-containing protein n=1 Tax=Pythium insidiosum TaxID=114742 RepID=A0AAD5Q6M1_PYTIN|nr:hypothetical protein P43SY_001088 [Pythium insidiosum]
MRPQPTASAAASSVPSNEDKTTALVATCSAMLGLALVLRLAVVVCSQRQFHQRNGRRVCGWQLKAVLHALDVSVYIVLWYAISIGMTLFNKWFLRVWADGGYPFSTTMTCINMFTKCLLSRLMNHCSSSKMTALPSRVYWRLAVPIGLCTSLDIMFSNLSFFYITVTFYTIVKSGGNVWNLLFSILLGHQRPSYSLFTVILLISSGISLASYGSTQFVWHGFVLVLCASIIGTLRWVLTQSLLKAMDESSNRILAVVYYISPASALGLLPIALATEGPAMLKSKFLLDSTLFAESMGFIFLNSCLAFALIFVEISLVKKTSALSLGIAGSFKDVTQIMLAVFIFGDRLIHINIFGLVVATCGMLFYAFLKQAESDAGRYDKVPTSTEGASAKEKQRSALGSPVVVHMQDGSPLTWSTSSSLSSSSSKMASDLELTRRESKEYVDEDDVQHV